MSRFLSCLQHLRSCCIGYIKLSPSARVCISDTTQPLMLLTLHTTLYDTIAHYTTLTYNTKSTFIVLKRLQQDFSFHLQCSLYKNVCQT